MRALIASLFLALSANVAAADPPHAIPSWVRVVDWDGQVFDYEWYRLERVTLCGNAPGDDVFANDGRGVALLEGDGITWQIPFAFKFYNQGAIAGDPDTTGDPLVLIEDADAIFSGGFDACRVYVNEG